jgi:transaldolase/glucose-6-phosphate isomerase
LLATAALAGRDKVTILAAEPISEFAAWLEQLLAESTGKHGKGLIPICEEPLGTPEVYGADRLFISLEMAGRPEYARQAVLDSLARAGHPIARIVVTEEAALGQEFFRWETAVAVAGAVMKLNPFDQPDVESAKLRAVALTLAHESGAAPTPRGPVIEGDGMALYADARNAETLAQLAESKTLAAYVSAHFKRAHESDYVGLLFYLDRNDRHRKAMQKMRTHLRDRLKVATVGGFGPRYLHSTGQAYKGGPNSGVFLQVTAEAELDIAIPGHKASFAIAEAAQAQGDCEVLEARGRRVLRLHLGNDIEGGLKRLADVIGHAVA